MAISSVSLDVPVTDLVFEEVSKLHSDLSDT